MTCMYIDVYIISVENLRLKDTEYYIYTCNLNFTLTKNKIVKRTNGENSDNKNTKTF